MGLLRMEFHKLNFKKLEFWENYFENRIWKINFLKIGIFIMEF